MSSHFINKLNSARVEPNPEWARDNRARLLARIGHEASEQPTSATQPVFIARKLLLSFAREPLSFRFSGIGLFVFAVLLSSYITKVAASDALPGEALYSVKRADEGVQKAVMKIVKEEDVPELELSFAVRRLEEAEKIAAGHQPSEVKKVKVKMAVSEVKTHVENAQQQINTLSDKGRNEEAVMAASLVDTTVKTLSESLATNTPALANLGEATPNAEVQGVIDDTAKAVGQASVDALELLVKQYQAGEPGISKDELKLKIGSKIGALESANSLETPPPTSNPTNPSPAPTPAEPPSSVPPATPSQTPPPADPAQTAAFSEKQEAIVTLLQAAKSLLEKDHILESFEKIKQIDELLNGASITPSAEISPPTSLDTPPIDEKVNSSNNEALVNQSLTGEGINELENKTINKSSLEDTESAVKKDQPKQKDVPETQDAGEKP